MITELNTRNRILLGPGPSNAHHRVLRALATPLIGHLDPQFVAVMDDIKLMLQETFKTRNNLTFAVSAPGSAGMETCLINLLEPGDTAVIGVNGVFGNRMADIVERCGATCVRVEAPWGQPLDPRDIKKAIDANRPKLVAVVHAETSTGVLQPLEEIGPMCRNVDALFVVDTVTSWCGTDVRVDEWGIDAVYAGSQKCLSAPPGVSPVSFSPRAVAAIENRKSKVQSWFLDVSLIKNYWEGAKRVYHHTAPVSQMFALREALRLVLEEGLEQRFERHRSNHALLREELMQLGFTFLVDEPYRLPMLNAVRLPDGVDDVLVRRALLDEFNIEVGAGLGEFAGKIWRVGLMGESSHPNAVHALTAALKTLLNR